MAGDCPRDVPALPQEWLKNRGLRIPTALQGHSSSLAMAAAVKSMELVDAIAGTGR